MKKGNERTVYFDYLRVFATFAVVILHLSGQNWSNTNVNGFDWQVFNVYDSLVRWTVPIFIMISGALFLERNMVRVSKVNALTPVSFLFLCDL